MAITKKKTNAPKAAEGKKPVKKTECCKKSCKTISAEDRFKMLELEAYLIAEKDGFKAHADHYWLQAEEVVSKKYPLK